MSTKALSNIVPGGSAAGSALGYRLLTLSGVSGPDAGFALATAGLGVGGRPQPDLLDRAAGVDPVPRRQPAVRHGRPRSGSGIMLVVALLVVGLQHGQGRAERFLHVARPQAALRPRHRHQRPAPDRRAAGGADRGPGAAQAGHPVGQPQLAARRGVAVGVHPRRSAARSTSTPCSSRSASPTSSPSSRSRPGGLGIVEGVYIPTLVGFGLTRRVATLGVASYRLAQLWLPILLGGILYASLRVGPWSIERRDRLDRLRDIARRETSESERRIEFALRQWERRRPGRAAPGRRGGQHRAAVRRHARGARGARRRARHRADAEGEYPGRSARHDGPGAPASTRRGRAAAERRRASRVDVVAERAADDRRRAADEQPARSAPTSADQ